MWHLVNKPFNQSIKYQSTTTHQSTLIQPINCYFNQSTNHWSTNTQPWLMPVNQPPIPSFHNNYPHMHTITRTLQHWATHSHAHTLHHQLLKQPNIQHTPTHYIITLSIICTCTNSRHTLNHAIHPNTNTTSTINNTPRTWSINQSHNHHAFDTLSIIQPLYSSPNQPFHQPSTYMTTTITYNNTTTKTPTTHQPVNNRTPPMTHVFNQPMTTHHALIMQHSTHTHTLNHLSTIHSFIHQPTHPSTYI